jgi:hypothetical protein
VFFSIITLGVRRYWRLIGTVQLNTILVGSLMNAEENTYSGNKNGDARTLQVLIEVINFQDNSILQNKK